MKAQVVNVHLLDVVQDGLMLLSVAEQDGNRSIKDEQGIETIQTIFNDL